MDDYSRYPALSPLARQAGFLGVLPFVAALVGVLSGSTELRMLGERLALGWGAAILAFVAAVHWGLALAGRWRWSLGVVVSSTLPSLIGAIAVMIGGSRGTSVLVVGFGFFWLYEHRRHGEELPQDYVQLRRVLSLTVCILLALITIGLGESS
jgi:ABC-type amino acid transport system permease subunit